MVPGRGASARAGGERYLTRSAEERFPRPAFLEERFLRTRIGFLQRTNARSGGLLFRHGWLVEVLLGLLTLDPNQRLTVLEAAAIARRKKPKKKKTTETSVAYAPPGAREIGRFGEGAQPRPAGGAELIDSDSSSKDSLFVRL